MKSNSIYEEVKSGKFWLTFSSLKEPVSFMGGPSYYSLGGVFLDDNEAKPFKDAISGIITRGKDFFKDKVSEIEKSLLKDNPHLSVLEFGKLLSREIVEKQDLILESLGIYNFPLQNSDKAYQKPNSPAKDVPLSEKDFNFKNKWHFKAKNKQAIDLYTASKPISHEKPTTLRKLEKEEINEHFKHYSICVGTFTLCLGINSTTKKHYFGIYPKSLVKIADAENFLPFKKGENRKSDLNEDSEFMEYLSSKF